MDTNLADPTSTLDVEQNRWRLDATRSRVEFHVRHFYGLMTVKGHFASFEGSLDLGSEPAVQLIIDADSLDTKHRKRDEHLRSADFFDVQKHPQVRFVSSDVAVQGDVLKVQGRLHAAGKSIPLQLDAKLRRVDGELEIDAATDADHRELGMTWSPLGILRAPSRLIVAGRLVPETSDEQ